MVSDLDRRDDKRNGSVNRGDEIIGTNILRLFIAGNSPRSANAILRVRELCDSYLKNTYRLEIVDIHQQTDLARKEQIVATPTLIKYNPIPKKVWIGDLTNTERILTELGRAS